MKLDFLNKKTIIILVVVLILIILAICGYFAYKKSKTPVTLTSNDNSFKLTVPGNIKFSKKDSDTLDIFSKKDEMILSSTVIKKEREIELSDAAALEMAGLPNIKTNLDNLSSLTKFELNGHEACKYSYTYFDKDYNNNFYVEIIWIKTDKNLYVLDLEVITKNQEKYKTYFDSIVNSFEEIN